MSKVLFTFLLVLNFLIPRSEVFAQEACVQMVCPAGTTQVSDTACATGQTGNRVAPTTPICARGKIPSNPRSIPNCICNPAETVAAPAPGAPAPAAPASTPCSGPNCTSGKGQTCPESPNGIKTAIGCIPTEPKALVEGLLKFATLAGGGVSFLLMLLGALQMITAEGNPEAIKHGQERFYSAIIGLLLIIFAVLLMQIIGVDILGLPGLKGPDNST